MPDSDPVPPRRYVRRFIGKGGAERRRPRTIMYTDAEWSAVQEAARLCGKTVASYVRDTSLGSRPKAPPSLARAELIRELGRSGTALVSLAATAKGTGALPEAASLQAALAELVALVRELATIPKQLGLPDDQLPG